MNQRIRTIIVEDELPNAKSLQHYLEELFPEVVIMDIIPNIPDAIKAVKKTDPDLIFLDIELPPRLGFELLEATKEMRYHTIFTTHHNSYAKKAFKYAASIHYLGKPINPEELKEAMAFYKDRSGYHLGETEAEFETLSQSAKKIFLEHLKQILNDRVVRLPGGQFITVKDILYCKAVNNYTYIYKTENKKIVVTKPLKHVIDLLQAFNFFRVHKSFLVNIYQVEKYSKGIGSVRMKDGSSLPVARNRKKDFLAVLAARGILQA